MQYALNYTRYADRLRLLVEWTSSLYIRFMIMSWDFTAGFILPPKDYPCRSKAFAQITYFCGAFVFDGDQALLFAVIDVAQLVVKQIGKCSRRSQQHQWDESGETAHPAAELKHLFTRIRKHSLGEHWRYGWSLMPQPVVASIRSLSASVICAMRLWCRHSQHHHAHGAATLPCFFYFSALCMILRCSARDLQPWACVYNWT